MSEIPTEITHDQYAVRLQKLQDLRAGGVDPFRASFEPTAFSAEALSRYVEGQDNTVAVKVAGRLVVMRDMGKSQFVKILDQQGVIQLYVKKDVARRRRLRGVPEARPRRHHRRRGHAVQNEERRGDRPRRALRACREVPPAASREVARPDRSRAGLPPALPGRDRQPGVAPPAARCAAGSCPRSGGFSRRGSSSRSRPRSCSPWRAGPRRSRSRRITTRSAATSTCAFPSSST